MRTPNDLAPANLEPKTLGETIQRNAAAAPVAPLP
jgi:hypothetical protein